MSRRQQSQRKPMPTAEAQIEKFSHDGRGIARLQGKTTFIEGALPGETLVFQYTKRKTDYDEGRAISILETSDLRAEPACQHYQQCGGCSLQHVNDKTQIHVKQELLLDLFQRIGHITPQRLLPPLTAESWHYRSKARLSVRFVEKKGKTLIGFREKYKPSYIAEINHCPILLREVESELGNMAALIDSFDDPRVIVQIEVAAGEDAVALIFRNLQSLTAADEAKLRSFGERTGFTLFLQPGGADSVYLFYSKSDCQFLHYTLPDEGLKFAFYPTDFTQVNLALNRKMIALAMELLDLNAEDEVLDLFCGLGNFSLPIAKRAKRVIGIEGSEMMVARATMNANANACHNTEFYAADLDKPQALLDLLAGKLARTSSMNNPSSTNNSSLTSPNCRGLTAASTKPQIKMLIDPPRTGALEIMKQIEAIQPARIVYVSCNPATLARDSDILVNQYGYRLEVAAVMDMFPHTAHVESIALFEKQGH
jgi:23S rRNA (uracil1939-C5)-methyltransferase